MLITTDSQLDKLIEKLSATRTFAWDTETTGLSPYKTDRIIGMSFGIPVKDGLETFYVPFRHLRGHLMNFNPLKIKKFAPIFSDPDRRLITWNGKFDCHMMYVDGIYVKCQVVDAMFAWHLVEETMFSFQLKEVAKRKIGRGEVMDDEHLRILLKSEKMDKGDMKNLSPIEAAPYAESDCKLTWELFKMVTPRVIGEGLGPIYREVCEFGQLLERMERKGIKVDPLLAEELIQSAGDREAELLAILRSMAGEDFNPKSNPQCQRWLGLRSTAKDVLEELQDAPGVSELLEYRGHTKALGTFYNPFRSHQDRFYRVHASFRVTGTVSGRLSCAEPNLQQIPRASSQWARVKQMIVAPKGYSLLEADLSQAELRMAAHHTQDPFLLQAYHDELDIHQMVGDEVGLSRQDAKTFNFAMIYGAGAPGISRQLRCSLETAKAIIRAYHKRVPGVRQAYYYYMNIAEKEGYVSYWSGRRRHFPFINGSRFKTQTAFNAMLQGGVGEIMRRAMLSIDRQLPEDAHMLVQVHDSILLEVKNKHIKDIAAMVKHEMENVHPFSVPMIAEVKRGVSWASMLPIA